MSYLALNLILALIWGLLAADLSLGTLAAGFLLGFAALALARPFLRSGPYLRAVVWSCALVFVFLYGLLGANLQLARDILRPRPRFRPGFFHFDAADLSATQRVLLANLISLTPGTLTVDADEERRSLYIHTLYSDEASSALRYCERFATLLLAIKGGAPTGEEEPWRRS